MPGPIIRVVRLVFDKRAARKTEREAKQSLSKTDRVVKSLKSTFVKLGLAISAAFVVQKIAAWGRAALQAGVKAEETFSKFNTVFGESAKSLDAFLDDWIRMAGVTETLGRDMAATFGQIGQGFGIAQDDAAVFAGRMVTLAGDFQSFFDVPIQETFEALRSGLTESEPLKRFGILILQAEVKTRALLETGKELASELTQAEIVQARVNLIYEKAGVVIGDLDRTSGSTANTIRRLGGAWDRLAESIGVAVVANNDARGGMNSLIETLERTKIWVDANAESFGAMATILGTVAKGLGLVLSGWKRIAEFVLSGWTNVVGLVMDGLANIVDGFALVQEGLNKVDRFFGADATTGTKIAEGLRRRAAALRTAATDLFATADLLRKAGFEGPEAAPEEGPAEEDGPPEKSDTKSSPEGLTPAEIKERNRLLAEATDIVEDGLTPLERYNREVALLGRHLAAGRIDIDQYARAFAQAQEILPKVTEETTRLSAALAAHQLFLDSTGLKTIALGDDFNALEEEAASLTALLIVMAEVGLDPLDQKFRNIVDRLAQVKRALEDDAEATLQVGEAARTAGQLIGAAFGGGIGRLASSKAKQNALLAAEHLAQAFASYLNPLTVPLAGGHLVAAGKFAAIATGWQALAASSGGGGGGGGAGKGAASSPGVSRDLGGRQSGQFDPAATEVHIHFVGEGFDAVNPRVQRVVAGAIQMVEERHGENTRVRVHRSASGGARPTRAI